VGIPASVIHAIAERRRPNDMLVDEAVVHDFCVELHEGKSVSDRLYADALALFGEHGVVDLMGINGYYTFLAMVMNTARTAVPAGCEARLPD
jgi:4-carboxymuconolactone decarboxylase